MPCVYAAFVTRAIRVPRIGRMPLNARRVTGNCANSTATTTKKRTINLRPTYEITAGNATAQTGWQPGYYIRCKNDGWVLANDSDRTSPAGDGTGTAFNGYFNGPSGHHEIGGDALRGWGIGGCVTYSLLGENALGKARAADCVQTLARQ